MTFKLLAIFLCALSCALLFNSSSAVADEPLKITDVLKTWQSTQDSLRSLDIAWTAEFAEATFTDDAKIPSVIRSTHERRLRICEDHYQYEAKGKRWQSEVKVHQFQDSTMFLTPKRSLSFFANAQEGELKDGVYLVKKTYPMGRVFKTTDGLDRLTLYDLRPLLMWARPLALRHQDFEKGDWTFSDKPQDIGGVSCILATRKKPGADKTERFWLAKEVSLLPMKLEFAQPSETGAEAITFSYELKLDPKSKAITGWEESQNSISGTFLQSSSVTIKELKINLIATPYDVEFTFPPGTHVTDEEKKSGYSVPEIKKR